MAKNKRQALVGAVAVAMSVCVLGMSVPAARAQGAPSGAPAAGNSNVGVAVQAQQQLQAPGPSVTPQSSTSQGAVDPSFRGSLVSGTATKDVLALTIDDAVSRGLKNNLGLILQSSNEKSASGARLVQLQKLLPTATAQASIEVEQVNLAAYGLKFPGLNPIIGPFQVEDFRAYLTQSLFNLQTFQQYMATKHNFEAAKLTAQDARDLVVITVGNAYLLCVADKARIEAVQAELATSKVSLDQANAAHEAGTSPRLDVLRAQVDYQNQQQQLISTQNQFEKDKLALARVIGLPLDQKFDLADSTPYKALETPDAEAAFQQALKQRKDLAAAEESLKAAEATKKAADEENLPSAKFAGDYGDIGETVGHSHGTFTATGSVSAPILQVAKTKGDRETAAAQVDQAKAKLSDQMQQVNADVRDAILDIESSAKLVDATKSNVDLANEALSEAQQRFKAGISDDLPVSQALAQASQANDQYISALYQHNVAKLALARALGVADSHYKDYLGGK